MESRSIIRVFLWNSKMSYQQQKQHESMGMPGIDTANKIEMKDDNEIEYLLVVNINSINDVEKVKRDSIL